MEKSQLGRFQMRDKERVMTQEQLMKVKIKYLEDRIDKWRNLLEVSIYLVDFRSSRRTMKIHITITIPKPYDTDAKIQQA